MYLRTILIVLALGALTLFTAVNWSAFNTPTTLSVIFATVEAPLGLVLLGMVVLLAALFLIYVVYLQSSVLLETRRHARELHSQRELAEHAPVVAPQREQRPRVPAGHVRRLRTRSPTSARRNRARTAAPGRPARRPAGGCGAVARESSRARPGATCSTSARIASRRSAASSTARARPNTTTER